MGWNEPEMKNAKIESTFLGVEDHGVLTYSIGLNYGGTFQHFTGPALIGQGKSVDMKWLEDLLKVVGAESWEQLKGKHVRAIAQQDKVFKIGNILKDEWFEWDSVKYKGTGD